MSRWTDALEELGPCEDGMAWAKGFNTRQAAWEACERPDWMLWFLYRMGTDHKLMVLLACDCAATALPIWKKKYPNDNRPAEAVRVARAWARGKATIEQVKAAILAAYASNAAAYAAYAAAYAANAAYAADAAYNTAYAAAAARAKANRRMVNLIRKRVPKLGRNPESTE